MPSKEGSPTGRVLPEALSQAGRHPCGGARSVLQPQRSPPFHRSQQPGLQSSARTTRWCCCAASRGNPGHAPRPGPRPASQPRAGSPLRCRGGRRGPGSAGTGRRPGKACPPLLCPLSDLRMFSEQRQVTRTQNSGIGYRCGRAKDTLTPPPQDAAEPCPPPPPRATPTLLGPRDWCPAGPGSRMCSSGVTWAPHSASQPGSRGCAPHPPRSAVRDGAQ